MKIRIPEMTITVPKPTAILRPWKWGLLALLALVVTLTWGQGGASQVHAGFLDRQIQLNVVDAFDQGKKLSDSCFLVFAYHQVEPPPADPINKPVDIVSDNNAKPLCDDLGPIKANLSDKNPAVGSIDITISSANQDLFGTIWHVQQIQPGQSQTTPKIIYNNDPTKWACDLLSADCPLTIKNVRKNGMLGVTFQAKPPLDPAEMAGMCAEIRDGFDKALKGLACDGLGAGAQTGDPVKFTTHADQDPSDAKILVSLTINNPFLILKGVYSIEPQTQKDPAGGFGLDPSQVPGDGDFNQLCDLLNNQACGITFAYALQPSEVNITKIGQYALPKTCFEVRDALQAALFTVCDNDFQGPPEADTVCIKDGVCEDEDPTEGFIRVTVIPGDYTVVETKVADHHTGDPSKLPCAAVIGGKCELTFVNTPVGMPWFPWDIDGNGAVTVADIFDVASQFGETKP